MDQLLQSLKTGELSVTAVPHPQTKENHLIVQTDCTLISSGTEKMLIEFGRANLIGKIKQQPEKARQVFHKIKTDGIAATLEAVQSKLDQPISLGYCHVGKILEVGRGCDEFTIGDRVVTNGPHAEIVRSPKNLTVKIPDNVDDESAAFSVLGAIALQGIRLANPVLGEAVVVIGLGLVGQLTVQLLLAQGCRVLGIDFDATRCALAKQFGADAFLLTEDADPVLFSQQFSRNQGVDAVLITASTDSDLPIKQAASMCRKRGRIVLIGVAGLNLSRDDFYKKELSFQVSCSYGPGRYDKNYEEKGQDYPLPYVRWTEKRNIEAVLDMMALGKINAALLITHRFIFSEAESAYKLLNNPSALGVLLKYPTVCSIQNTISISSATAHTNKKMVMACIGAGNFASRILLPIFKKNNIKMHTLVSDQGISSVLQGKKFGFKYASSDFSSVINNNNINAVVITTPNYLHADQIISSLLSGKHVFVEKPLAISKEQLTHVAHVYGSMQHKPILMIGFNRRFSPFIQKIKQLLQPLKEPKNIIMTVNAGFIPKDHWVLDEKQGGGRLLGEACHFVDLLRYIAEASMISAEMQTLNSSRYSKNENMTIVLKFGDGSVGTVHYCVNGHASFSKERLEIFCAGKVLQLDNFRKLLGFGFSNFKKMSSFRQQKGHTEEITAFIEAVENAHPSPIIFGEIYEVMETCLNLL